MAIKTISLSEKSYNKLKNLKEGNESFSEVVMKLAESQNLSQFSGKFPEIKGEEQ